MTTLNLTPEQKEAVWNALEDRVDEIKKDRLECDDLGLPAIAELLDEELKALREVLEIIEIMQEDEALECFEGKRLR